MNFHLVFFKVYSQIAFFALGFPLKALSDRLWISPKIL
jgi:hypothetical protein